MNKLIALIIFLILGFSLFGEDGSGFRKNVDLNKGESISVTLWDGYPLLP